MTTESAFGLYVATGAISALAVGFALPPLTQGRSLIVSQESQTPQWRSANTYCEENLSGVSCLCFAAKASHISETEVLHVEGFSYAGQKELARNQAKSSC